MILGHLHLQRLPGIAKVLGNQHGALLTDQQRGGEGVAADVVGADGQVGDLEALDAVHVEARVEDAVLDDGVAFAGGHGTGAEGVPGSFDVAFDPSFWGGRGVSVFVGGRKLEWSEWV